MLARGIAATGIAAGVALTLAVSGGARVAKTSSAPLTGKVALPPVGQAIVDEFTVDATASRGNVGALRLRTTNEAQLPSGVRAMAAITPAKPNQRTAKFTVLLAINNLPVPAPDAATAAGPEFNFQVLIAGPGIIYKERVIHLKSLDCEQLKNEAANVDAGVQNETFSVQRLRRKADEPSDPESVFDFSAVNAAQRKKPPCPVGPGGVEPADPGDT